MMALLKGVDVVGALKQTERVNAFETVGVGIL